MSPGLPAPVPIPEQGSRDDTRLRVQRRLARCLHHELRGSLNGVGLQLTLLGRLSRGELDARPAVRAKAPEWVDAARQELDAVHSWGNALLALMATDDDAEPSDVDLAELLSEYWPLLTTFGRRSGVVPVLDPPPSPMPLHAPVDDLRLALLELTTDWLGHTQASETPRVCVREDTGYAVLRLTPWPDGLEPSPFSCSVFDSVGLRATVDGQTLSLTTSEVDFA